MQPPVQAPPCLVKICSACQGSRAGFGRFAAYLSLQGRLLALDRSEHKLRALMAMARQQGYGHMIRTQVPILSE